MVLEKYNSKFITYDLIPGIYTFKDLSEVLYNIVRLEHPESSSGKVIKFDNISRKTKLVVNSGVIAIRFDENSFFSFVLGFTPGWDYKHYIEYNSRRIVNLSSTNKIHLKIDVIDGSRLSGLRQPILFSFVLDKKPGYKVFCEPETIHYKKYINLF